MALGAGADVDYVVVASSDDDAAERFRRVLGRRHFLDRESGVLLVWTSDTHHELPGLVARIEARHPGTRFTVQRTGAAVAVRISARDEDLAAVEALYLDQAG